MKIQQETLDALKAQGIIVSPFPTDEAEVRYRERKTKEWEEGCRYRECKSYFENGEWHKEHGEETEGWQERLQAMVTRHMDSPMSWMGKWYDTEHVYIRKGEMLFKRSVQKGKVYDEAWVLGVVAREEKAYSGAYGQFAKDVQKMFADKFGSIGFIYPTTYGIGVWIFYNWKSNECIEKVREVLDGMGIEYTNEFSDAKFVYRFKISKKEVNRKKLVA